ncbi:MAG: DUF1800 domain-containing protein [Cytophagales bacterium]|nr:DUF1800 domain-containing protein [Cytophagales bacterium]
MSVSYSLNPYTGQWTIAEAGHLLRRTMFGPTYKQMADATTNGMHATVSSLMNISATNLPLSFHDDEHLVQAGQTWVNSVYPTDGEKRNLSNNARMRSLQAWIMQNINNEQDGLSITEKMTFFWQNHFGTTTNADARGAYDYVILLRNNALGNFKQLVKDVTVHPIMLVFLNGNTNSVQSPNENYARELLELFTIGKGPQIGTGDYTHYTEYDISECAKVLTGYRNNGYRSDTETSFYSYFDEKKHNDTVKTLSNKFGNAVIQPNGENEYKDLIDIIFQQQEVSKYICRKLYRFFVSSEISDEVESQIISTLATTLRTNNYEIQLVLEQLLKSEHFYDISHRGCFIKSPLDMIFSIWNGTETKPNYDFNTNYQMFLSIYGNCTTLDLSFLAPPSVAGWPVYYQAPVFTRLWLNASLIKSRVDIINWWVLYKGISKNDKRLNVIGLDFLNNLPNPENANTVIDCMIKTFLPKGTTDAQRENLRLVLTNELPNFEWTIQYNEYLDAPNDTNFSDPISVQIKKTLTTLFSLPEFQTI